uniref:Uncharacterized protein n=1 Tax=Oryza glumipatula TaxID=40148 RepID=A0A0D9YYS8_9ORYZ
MADTTLRPSGEAAKKIADALRKTRGVFSNAYRTVRIRVKGTKVEEILDKLEKLLNLYKIVHSDTSDSTRTQNRAGHPRLPARHPSVRPKLVFVFNGRALKLWIERLRLKLASYATPSKRMFLIVSAGVAVSVFALYAVHCNYRGRLGGGGGGEVEGLRLILVAAPSSMPWPRYLAVKNSGEKLVPRQDGGGGGGGDQVKIDKLRTAAGEFVSQKSSSVFGKKKVEPVVKDAAVPGETSLISTLFAKKNVGAVLMDKEAPWKASPVAIESQYSRTGDPDCF